LRVVCHKTEAASLLRETCLSVALSLSRSLAFSPSLDFFAFSDVHALSDFLALSHFLALLRSFNLILALFLYWSLPRMQTPTQQLLLRDMPVHAAMMERTSSAAPQLQSFGDYHISNDQFYQVDMYSDDMTGVDCVDELRRPMTHVPAIKIQQNDDDFIPGVPLAHEPFQPDDSDLQGGVCASVRV